MKGNKRIYMVQDWCDFYERWEDLRGELMTLRQAQRMVISHGSWLKLRIVKRSEK